MLGGWYLEREMRDSVVMNLLDYNIIAVSALALKATFGVGVS